MLAVAPVLPDVAGAQSFIGIPAVDSASVARAAWSSAVKAFRLKDIATARAEVERASSAWPTQPTYVWYRAALAAEQGDTAAVASALRDYARLGLGRDLSDSTLDRFRARPWFAAVAKEHELNRAVLARSRVRHTLSDSTLWPEGVDHDARTGNFYVASVRQRTIVEVAADGRERELWPRDQSGVGAAFGVRVDPRRNILWATMSGLRQMSGFAPSDSAIAALLEIRIRDGAILRRWDLSPGRKHTLGDLAVGPQGDVFVTDSDDPVLYRLRPGGDTLEALRNPLFRSLQGIAPSPDANVIYVADYSHGLLRVDLRSSRVTRVDEAANITTLGCDGIVWHENAIVAVQNGVSPARVMRFGLDAAGTRVVGADVLDRNWVIADEPTIGTIVGNDFVYVANSQWEKYSAEGNRVPGSKLTRPVLLAVPLRP